MANGRGGDGRAGWLLPVLVVVAILVVLGLSRRATTDPTATPVSVTVTTGASTAVPALLSCPGQVVQQRTENDIVLRVYYDARDKGLNCVQAVVGGGGTAAGYLRTELRFASYPGTQWPEYASQTGPSGVADLSGPTLLRTDQRCVTALAVYYPSGPSGPSSSVSLTRVACG